MKHFGKRFLALLLAVSMVVPMAGMESLAATSSGEKDVNPVVREEVSSDEATVEDVELTVADERAVEDVDSTVTDGTTVEDVDSIVADESTANDESVATDESTTADESVAVDESTTADESATETDPEYPVVDTNHEIVDDLHNQYGAVLYKEGLLSCEDDSVNYTHDEKSDSLLISGNYETMKDARFLIDKEFDFQDAIIGRFSVDMVAKKKTTVTVGFYLDDEETPFATMKLNRQKKENDWSYVKNQSFDIYDRKLTGKHRLSFAILENEKTSDKVTIAFHAVEFVKSTVPVIYFDIDESEGTIDAMNASDDHSVECYGNMNIRVPEDYQSEYGKVEAGLQTYELDYVRGRGNSTWNVDKKPYKVKLAKKADLLGMGKQKHWVLLANWYDNSLLRNKFTYWLGEKINAEVGNAYEFTPASVPVDVVMNGEYYGSYYLCEQIRMGENRVDLKNLEDYPEAEDEATISGGYLLSVEPYGDEEKVAFATKRGNSFLIESPDFGGNINRTQVNYIKSFIQKTENAIYGEGFKDEDGTSYKDLMDVVSTAYYYMMQEFSMNGDGFISTSTYLYKRPDVYDENGALVERGKLYWGPLWDFDFVAWGSTEYSNLYTSGWFLNDRIWFERLFEDPEYSKMVVEQVWPVLKAALEEGIADGGALDQYYAQLESSASYNFEKWGPTPLDFWDESDYESNDESDDEYVDYEPDHHNDLTFEEELARLKQWTRERIDWVDSRIGELVPQECVISFPGTKLPDVVGIQGREFREMPAAPKKKGYTFQYWLLQCHFTYEEFMKQIGLETYEGLVDLYGEETAARIKKEGSDYECSFDNGDYLPWVGKIEAHAQYIKNSEIVQPEKIYFGYKQYNFTCYEKYDFYDLSYSVKPSDAYISGMTWTSSDTKVATVDNNGCVLILDPGVTTIKVSTSSGVSASCKVKVYSEEEMEEMGYDCFFLYDYDFSASSLKMNLDGYKQLRVNTYPETAAYSYWNMQFYSTDYSVADVDNAGVVHALNEGSCLVYAVCDGMIRTCKVTVKDPKKLHTGDTFTRKGLKYQVTSAKNRTVTCIGTSKKSITKVTIPSSFTYKNKKVKVTAVKSSAFKGLKKLKTVVIGSNVKSIGSKAFYNCTKLTSVTIGKAVATEGSKAFYNCKSLKTLKIKAEPHKVYSKAYSKIGKSVKIYVPKKWVAYYKEFFKGKKVIKKY